MLNKPAALHYFLSNHGLIDGIYKAMENEDSSVMVMKTLDALKNINYIPPLIKTAKTEESSTVFRNEGNAAYRTGKYQKTMELYNKALLYAPVKSKAMILAYSNRSALLLKVKAYSACLWDIDMCYHLGGLEEIEEKLKKRKEEALRNVWMERLAEGATFSTFCDEYFKLNTRRNPQIPCATTAVGVITEDQVPKIVAATDIKVGTVVALEHAFVSQSVSQNHNSSCHHCQKMSLNLIPCTTCCFALFCDEDCMDVANDEYHGVECQIIEIIQMISYGSMSILAVQATLKICKMAGPWPDVINCSRNFGISKMRSSSINDIFNSDSLHSLLCFRDDVHFVHGAMYNSAFACAVIIFYLEKIKTFFPKSAEGKEEAMRAVARISMFLTLYGTHTQITQAVSVAVQGKTEFHDTPNFGWFSFAGKLRHACNPNLIVAGLNNAVALIAIQPIKRGSELTISYLGHFLDNPFNKTILKKNMFSVYGIVCDCVICSGEWEMRDQCELTDVQKKNLRKLNLNHMKEVFNPREVPDMFQKLCKSLAFLQDVPYSKEYRAVFGMFKKCVLAMMNSECDNNLVDYIRD